MKKKQYFLFAAFAVLLTVVFYAPTLRAEYQVKEIRDVVYKEVDGEKITLNIDSLGFILGDEGSGANLGKRMITDYIRRKQARMCGKGAR